MLRLCFGLLMVCASFSSTANESVNEDIHRILNASAGQWQGEEFYSDYQTGEQSTVHVQVDAQLTSDQAILIRHQNVSNSSSQVSVVSLLTYDTEAGQLVESVFQSGKGELIHNQITHVEFEDDEHWQLQYQHQVNEGRAAVIRHTVGRHHSKMSSVVEVNYLDGGAGFVVTFRGQLTLLPE